MTADHVDFAASRAILIGISQYCCLPEVPQANESLGRFYKVLTDPNLGRWPPDRVIAFPELGRPEAMKMLREYADAARGALLVYFVGHGIPNGNQELFLALRPTTTEHPEVDGIAYEDIRDAVSRSMAAVKMIILDCCWSSDVEPPRASPGGAPRQTKGVIVLTASVDLARADAGSTCTAFTGALLKHIEEGIPGEAEYLTVGALYRKVEETLAGSGLPAPSQKVVDTASDFRFARNAAYRQPRPATRPKPRWADSGYMGRKLDSTRLLDAVRSSPDAAVVVVTGLAGVGKSVLARHVLGGGLPAGVVASVDRRHDGSWLFWHELAPGTYWDAAALVGDLDQVAGRPERVPGDESVPDRVDESVLDRLDMTIEAIRDRAVTVVVDAAQNLLLPGTNRFPLDLDEALELLTTRRYQHRVKLVFVMREMPSSPRGIWPHQMEHLPMKGMGRTDFADYIRSLDTHGQHGLRQRSDGELDGCWRVLNGNPRLAELLCTLLDLDESIGFDAHVERFGIMRVNEVMRQLRADVTSRLREVSRLVLRAVAALQMPVPPDTVSALLGEDGMRHDVPGILERLASRRLLSTVNAPNGTRYFVPASESDDVLSDLGEDERSRLLLRASYELSNCRLDPSEVHEPRDLAVQFAELEARLRARAYRAAFRSIESIDDELQRWRLGGLLVPARERVSGHLDDVGTTINSHALGHTYAEQRRFPEALGQFRMALDSVARTSRPELRRRILLSIGSTHWLGHKVTEAERYYGYALSTAEEFADVDGQGAALDGLARCHRHRGEYQEACRLGMRALSTAQAARSPDAVGCALRLSRWYAEVGDRESARRLLDAAGREAYEHGEGALVAAYLDGWADVLLADSDPAAVPVARTAVETALRSHHPAVLVHARTTLAYAHLGDRDPVRALREIERAARYRDEEASLVVVAMHALASLGVGQGAKADDLFNTLNREASGRAPDDATKDFVAHYMRGIALCAIDGRRGRSLSAARAAFATARSQPTMSTPGLGFRLAAMLETLNRYRPHDELSAVIADLQAAGTPSGAS